MTVSKIFYSKNEKRRVFGPREKRKQQQEKVSTFMKNYPRGG